MPQDKTGSSAARLVYTDEAVEDNVLFWTLIEDAERDADALLDALLELDPGELVAFGLWVREAVQALADRPMQLLAADSRAVFLDWIVSQGRAFWVSLVRGDDAALAAAYGAYTRSRVEEAHPLRWRGCSADGVVLCGESASAVYLDSFGEDFYLRMDALYAETWRGEG